MNRGLRALVLLTLPKEIHEDRGEDRERKHGDEEQAQEMAANAALAAGICNARAGGIGASGPTIAHRGRLVRGCGIEILS